jgi:hypothetical protein
MGAMKGWARTDEFSPIERVRKRLRRSAIPPRPSAAIVSSNLPAEFGFVLPNGREPNWVRSAKTRLASRILIVKIIKKCPGCGTQSVIAGLAAGFHHRMEPPPYHEALAPLSRTRVKVYPANWVGSAKIFAASLTIARLI